MDVPLVKGGKGVVVGLVNRTIGRTINLKTSQKSIGPGIKSYVWDVN